MKIILAAIALAIAAPALASREDRNVAQGEAQLQTLLKGAVPGTPSTCLPLVLSSDSQTIPGVGILYGSGRRTYLMRFKDGCPMLDRHQIIVTRSVGRMCRGDIAQIVESSAPALMRGTCIVGDFTPYTRPKRR